MKQSLGATNPNSVRAYQVGVMLMGEGGVSTMQCMPAVGKPRNPSPYVRGIGTHPSAAVGHRNSTGRPIAGTETPK